MRVVQIDNRVDVVSYDADGTKHNFKDVSAIIFDGQDAIIQLRDRCLVKHSRLFENMLISVVERDEPIEEPLPWQDDPSNPYETFKKHEDLLQLVKEV